MKIKNNKEMFEKVTLAMHGYVKPYITPISKILSRDAGEHLGSGSYFEFENNIYLITCEHVAIKQKLKPLTHKFQDNEDIFMIQKSFVRVPLPLDVGITKIDMNLWNTKKHMSLSIPFNKFSRLHKPVEDEFLFLDGYSSEMSKFQFGYLFNPGIFYAACESPFKQILNIKNEKVGDCNHHFTMSFSPEKIQKIKGNKRELPDPHGMSGTLIWNTRFVECGMAGKEWDPSLSYITGILWGWSTSHANIIATKIEHLHLEELMTNFACKL